MPEDMLKARGNNEYVRAVFLLSLHLWWFPFQSGVKDYFLKFQGPVHVSSLTPPSHSKPILESESYLLLFYPKGKLFSNLKIQNQFTSLSLSPSIFILFSQIVLTFRSYLCRNTIYTHRRKLIKEPVLILFFLQIPPSKWHFLACIKHGALQKCDSGLTQCSVIQRGTPGLKEIWEPWGPGQAPLNSSEQGQTIRSGRVKHVSSFRGAPNDILIWKIINNRTPTTSPATSQGMCSGRIWRSPW